MTSYLRFRTCYWIVVAAVGFAMIGAAAQPAFASYAQIEGSGSTWSKNIVDQWIATVDSKGIKAVYTGTGSTAGRKSFAAGTTDFGITEVPYQPEDGINVDSLMQSRPFAYLPIVAGGTAFTYQIKVGTTQVTNLRLSGETIAKIFTGKITNWNDPAITRDMNGTAMPNLPIKPVVRSDGSGTTAQFTAWMDNQYPSIWRPYFGKSGLTSDYPRKVSAMIGASGSDQVMNNITSSYGNGMIGYVEYSYPYEAKYPVVKVLNKGGYFTLPTDKNVAVALTKAVVVKSNDLTKHLTSDLSGVYVNPDVRTYGLSSYSYMLIPIGAKDPRMTTPKRQSLADFMFYSLCEGQQDAGAFGYSPLPLNLVSAGFEQLSRLKTADPGVDIASRDVTKCHNPTFDGTHLDKNLLAATAPLPAACDKVGAGPCTAGTVGAATTTADSGAAAAAGVDPATGLPFGSTDSSTATGSAAVATDLVAARAGDARLFGALAALELLLLVLAPGVGEAFLRRRRKAAS